MTKDQLQKELKDKVKEGVKPSHLKKLKRSKSEGDIPKTPPLPQYTPLSKSQSQQSFKDPQYPYTTLISQQAELEKLQKASKAKSDTISLLRKKIEQLETHLKNNPPSPLLSDQLAEKQKQIENLRKQLEVKQQELAKLKNEQSTVLDDNLTLKHQSLKDWWQQYEKTKELDKELTENIDYASAELVKQDEAIERLRSENNHLKITNQSLQKDLDLATKLAELRKNPPFYPEDSWTNLKYALYSFAAVVFTVWLTKSFKNIQESPNYD